MDTDPIEQWFQEGLEHHQAGRLAEAARAYARVLEHTDDHADALHLAGVIEHQSGRHDRAAELIRRAVAADPGDAAFHNNLAEALRAQGQLADAAEAYEHALAIDASIAEVWRGLGAVHHRLGQFDAALTAWRAALALSPDHPETLNNYGVSLEAAGRIGDAVDCFRRARQASGGSHEATVNLARTLAAAEEYAEAIELAHGLVRGRPDDVKAHTLLAAILSDAGRYDEALTQMRDAVRIDPLRAETHFALGCVFDQAREFAGSMLAYGKCIELNPKLPAAYLHRGLTLMRLGRLDDALTDLKTAVEINPSFYEGQINLASALHEAHRLDDAAAAAERALALRPDDATAMIVLGALLVRRGEISKADAQFQRALRVAPDHPYLLGNYAGMLTQRGDAAGAMEVFAKILAKNAGDAAYHSNLLLYLNGLPDIEPRQLFDEHKRWAERHESRVEVLGPSPNLDLDPGRRLRVGYVSADWRTHSVAYFMLPILAGHDHASFTVVAYDNVPSPDELSHHMRGLTEEWYRVPHLSDERLAEKIRADRIDILVDLSGHTGGNRLLTFARRPAPVQVSYLGYPNTTGLAAMGYRITDDVADPPGVAEPFHTERLVRLPGCFLCYFAPAGLPEPGELPAAAGAPITFCSFNALPKYNPSTVDAWARVICAVPGSKMMLKANGLGDLSARRRIIAMFEAAGVAEGRLDLVQRAPTYTSHLAHYDRCDIALETFPYNGTTTTCEAMFMGVPVVTRYGDTHVLRVGGSLMTAVGLPEVVARSPDDFVSVAVSLASDLPRLAELRRTMRERMRRSPLMDARGHTGRLEVAYRQMWRQWCASATGGGHAAAAAT